MKYLIVFLVFLGGSCSTSKLIYEWKSPQSENFQVSKILVAGITGDKQIRHTFEKELATELENNGMIAVRSVDFFEASFSSAQQSEADLNAVGEELLENGFDAILLTKITGQHSKANAVESYRNLAKPYQRFRDYYYSNQHIYQREQSKKYRVYTSETSLFCICPGKDRELLWKGQIDITAPNTSRKGILDLVKTQINALKNERILVSQK